MKKNKRRRPARPVITVRDKVSDFAPVDLAKLFGRCAGLVASFDATALGGRLLRRAYRRG
jgi:hypothetical protein